MTMRMRMMMKGPQLLSTIVLLSAVRPHHRSSSLLASAFFTSRVSHHGTIRMMASSSSTTTTTSNINQKQIMQDALYRIRDVNHVPPHIRESLIPFCVDGRVVGQVTPAKAQVLVDCPPAVFELVTESSSSTSSSSSSNPILTLSSHCGSTPDERTAAVAQVTDQLRQQGLIPGWRNELFPVAASFDEAPLFLMERAAVPSLGVLEYGIHINGIVQATNNDTTHTQMWMARRSLTKSKHPGMLDQMVAGGQPAGLSLLENCRKECAEEAGIPPHLTHRIVPAGAISYEQYIPSSDTLSRVVLFNFDLPLPADFIPTPVDGEVEEFFLWTVPELLQSLSPDFPDPLKPNCYVVVIDWLVRQGHLSPDTPGYLDVLRELRSGDCQ